MRSLLVLMALIPGRVLAQTQPLPTLPPQADVPTQAAPIETAPSPPPKTPRIVYVDTPAQPPEPVQPAIPPPPERDNVISISVFPLFRPFAAFVYERRALSWLGVGALAGVGAVEIGTSGKRVGFQLGPQVQAYPVGSFHHGMPVGFELVLMTSTGTLNDGRSKVTSTSINPALTIGYKVETHIGITLDARVGLRYSTSRITIAQDGIQASATESQVEPLFRLLVGYAF
jgi:hypothetical protein